MGRFARRLGVATLGALICLFALPSAALACGCLSPPVEPTNFAVNQEAEQILFEVPGDGTVTAHVLIRFAGDPATFAWLLPVPNVPDLELSETLAFGILDELTRPQVTVREENLCPDPAFVCERHPAPDGCVVPTRDSDYDDGEFNSPAPGGFADAGSAAAGDAAGGSAPPVEVLARETVGSYETVTFAATDASAATTWLQDNGFIVNDTMAPYMQPYLDAGMAFVAAKLTPGAGADELRPLAVTYQGDRPMIPLKLTAVAAEPEMTVTAFIYAHRQFEPVDKPVVTIPEDWITRDNQGRINYPMALSRAVDEAGGDGFVVEFFDAPPRPGDVPGGFSNCGPEGCTAAGNDAFGSCAGDDCPANPVQDAIDLLEGLADEHARLTRITTRLSPHEMTFDPVYRAVEEEISRFNRLVLRGSISTLRRCEDDVIDKDAFAAAVATQACATTWCGRGQCGVADGTAACVCDEGFVARRFNDLDGAPSITCIPAEGTVDFSAGGLELRSACEGVDCGVGDCVDVGGFPTCQCPEGGGGLLDEGRARCAPIRQAPIDAGARDYSAALADLDVCAPAVRTRCGDFAWYVPNTSPRIEGVVCDSSRPEPAAMEVPAKPTCADYGWLPPGSDPSGGGGRGGRELGEPSTTSINGGGTGAAPEPDTSTYASEPGEGSFGGSCAGGPAGGLGAWFALLGLAAIRRRRTA